jgi:hypothetical protein
MPICRMLDDCAFDADHIAAITAAYENVLASLGLVDRSDPMTELVAKKVIACAADGERDATRIRECALQAFR